MENNDQIAEWKEGERPGTASEFIDRAIGMLKEQYKDEWLIAGYNGIVALLGYAKTKIERRQEELNRQAQTITDLTNQLEEAKEENESLKKEVNTWVKDWHDTKNYCVSQLNQEREKGAVKWVKAEGENNRFIKELQKEIAATKNYTASPEVYNPIEKRVTERLEKEFENHPIISYLRNLQQTEYKEHPALWNQINRIVNRIVQNSEWLSEGN